MMEPTESITKHFQDLADPRVERTRLHSLHDILVITLCAVICGADGWVAVELFGKRKFRWLKTFLDLPNGIPAHDTFGRVFAALDPIAFKKCFTQWVASVTSVCEGEVIAVDGKTLRRSFDTASGRAAIHMVNAWASGSGISLGQLATEEKSNEITAIPKLLEMLVIKGCIVTTDAMGCQKAIAETITAQQGDYVLALKGNQGTFHDDVVHFFDWACSAGSAGSDAPELTYQETVDGQHGRIEIRRYWMCGTVDFLKPNHAWAGLQSIAKAENETERNGKTTRETRYFISSLPNRRSEEIRNAIRAHWSVENSLHWVLDVAFREDDCRIRQGYAAENFATVRQMALNLLKQDTSVKVGIANKRLVAALDETYLLKVLGF